MKRILVNVSGIRRRPEGKTACGSLGFHMRSSEKLLAFALASPGTLNGKLLFTEVEKVPFRPVPAGFSPDWRARGASWSVTQRGRGLPKPCGLSLAKRRGGK